MWQYSLNIQSHRTFQDILDFIMQSCINFNHLIRVQTYFSVFASGSEYLVYLVIFNGSDMRVWKLVFQLSVVLSIFINGSIVFHISKMI